MSDSMAAEDYARDGRCDNTGFVGFPACAQGHPKATVLFKATAFDDVDAQEFWACGDCAPRVREFLLTGGGFAVDEFRL